MKFRAIMTDLGHMKEFLSVVHTISKIYRQCLIRIQPNGIMLIVTEEISQSIALVWCNIPREIFFPEYIMNGIDDIDNEILILISTGDLAFALACIKNNPNYVKMKLSMKDVPCIIIEIDTLVENSVETNKTTHDIPINFIPKDEWDEFTVPSIQNFHISIQMPSLRSIKNVVEKLKKLAPFVTFCATATENIGELALIVETDEASVTSTYENLFVHATALKLDEEMIVSCRSDLKKLSLFLSSIQFYPSSIWCKIIEDYVIKIEVKIIENVVLNCVIPAIAV